MPFHVVMFFEFILEIANFELIPTDQIFAMIGLEDEAPAEESEGRRL